MAVLSRPTGLQAGSGPDRAAPNESGSYSHGRGPGPEGAQLADTRLSSSWNVYIVWAPAAPASRLSILGVLSLLDNSAAKSPKFSKLE
jgi:hypothetical protein